MKILIVDDEEMLLEEMKCIVQEVKPEAEIICADSCNQALDVVRQEMVDVAFLDIEMPQMNGIELARQLKDKCPNMNIVFATAYSKYALDAFSVYVSDYLLKPINKKQVEKAFTNFRIPVQYEEHKLRVQCFGKFEVFYQEEPVTFRRSLAKEMFAYLVDLKGASANTAEICAVLWEDSVKAKENRSYFRSIVAELKRVLKECGAEHVFVCKRNHFAIVAKEIECDYYKFLEGDIAAVNSYQGEYMSQYSWAEMTTGTLEK